MLEYSTVIYYIYIIFLEKYDIHIILRTTCTSKYKKNHKLNFKKLR